MKRSETLLVYGVTGILVVILGIAVVFGNDPVALASSGQETQASGDLEQLLDPALFDSEGLDAEGAGLAEAVEARLPLDAEEASASGIDDPFGLESGQLGPVSGASKGSDYVLAPDGSPLQMALNMKPAPTVDSLFGRSSIKQVGRATRYRVIEVAAGDSFSTLVERWCGSAKLYMDDAVALNEQIDINRLPVGSEVWLPYVEDAELIEAYQERIASGRSASDFDDYFRPASQSQAAAASRGIRRSSAESGTEYVVQPGESLWVIAVRKVSARQAKSYIEEILGLNPKITDPSRVRSGMKIMLPAAGS